ncbi:MAG: nitroreductase [Clostridiales bacterium]|nr:nitroreductase [Clostridiales bacterium]
MNLYETIFARRSVRQYDKTPLDAAALTEIKNHVDGAKQILGQSARFEIADSDKLKGGFAPHAILAFSEDSDAALVNVGCTLQGMDLWLQSSGYGSIWCGMAAPKDAAGDYRILLGFGKTSVPLRTVESEFKRKKISDISNEDNAVARAARLAPSAVNFQPWKLTFAAGKVTAASNVRGVGRILPGRLYLIDLGIVLKHVVIALEHEGKTVTAIDAAGAGKDSAIEVSYE